MLFLCFMIAVAAAYGQLPRKLTQTPGYQLTLDEPSVLKVPPGYDAKKKYPLVVFLPFTGGTADMFFNEYIGYGKEVLHMYELMDSLKRMPTEQESAAYKKILDKSRADWTEGTWDIASMIKTVYKSLKFDKAFFALVPTGAGSTKDHSWQGFEACIYRYENKILNDIKTYSKQYSIDTTRIILAGYSLGGDLSWAISQRYPEKFRGAIVNGSSCSYAEKGMMARQAKQGARIYFALGESELARRTTGTLNAKALLDKAGIKNKLSRMRGEHVTATREQFREALDFLLFENGQ